MTWKCVKKSVSDEKLLKGLLLIEKTCTALGTRPLKATLKTFDQCKSTINVTYHSLMTRESKNMIPPSPPDAAPVVGHVNIVRRTNEDCSHNLRRL